VPVDAPPPPPTCAFFGQGCSGTVTCCSSYLCAVVGTRNACNGAANCVCTQVID
jgi:hypothetical protein